jgi:hypothetical protein
VIRTVALLFESHKLPVDERKHRSPARQANLKWSLALAAALLLPGEGKSRHG